MRGSDVEVQPVDAGPSMRSRMLAAVVLAAALGGGGVAVASRAPAASGETVEAAATGRDAGDVADDTEGASSGGTGAARRAPATAGDLPAGEHEGAALEDGAAPVGPASAGSSDGAAVPAAAVAASGSDASPGAAAAPTGGPASAPAPVPSGGEPARTPQPATPAAAPAPAPAPPPPSRPAKPPLPTGALRNADAQRSWQLVNELRADRGLAGVQLTADAIDKAQALAEKMAAESALSHSPSLYAALDGRWSVVTENVGYGASVDEVHRLLMADPPHLHHMIDPGVVAGGIGAARGADGAVYIAQIFVG